MVTAEIFDKLRELQDILARKNQLDSEILEAPRLLVKQEELLAQYKTNYIRKNTDDGNTMPSIAKFRMLPKKRLSFARKS